jgi:hypothetical protein
MLESGKRPPSAARATMYPCGWPFWMVLAIWGINRNGPKTGSGFTSCLFWTWNLIGNPETCHRERGTECTVHCNPPSPHKFHTVLECAMNTLPSLHRQGVSCLVWTCPGSIVGWDASPHRLNTGEIRVHDSLCGPILKTSWWVASKLGSIHTLIRCLCPSLSNCRAWTCCYHFCCCCSKVSSKLLHSVQITHLPNWYVYEGSQ